jgi:hypothetical protein
LCLNNWIFFQNEILKRQYNITDSMFMLIAQGAQTFVKQSYPLFAKREYYGAPYPFNCTEFPWNSDTQMLWTEQVPGEPEAVCSLNQYYCESQDHMTLFYKKFLAPFQDQSKTAQFELESHLLSLSLEDQCSVAGYLIGRAGYDGEMAGSGAAMDPLFWVAHGAVERLMQKVIFAGITTDTDYDVTDANCSGHMNKGTKAWLKGFYFSNKTVTAQSLTNVELNEFLNPTTDEYRDNFNFVYDIDSKFI